MGRNQWKGKNESAKLESLKQKLKLSKEKQDWQILNQTNKKKKSKTQSNKLTNEEKTLQESSCKSRESLEYYLKAWKNMTNQKKWMNFKTYITCQIKYQY